MKGIPEVAFEDPTLSSSISRTSVEELDYTTWSMLGIIEGLVSIL